MGDEVPSYHNLVSPPAKGSSAKGPNRLGTDQYQAGKAIIGTKNQKAIIARQLNTTVVELQAFLDANKQALFNLGDDLVVSQLEIQKFLNFSQPRLQEVINLCLCIETGKAALTKAIFTQCIVDTPLIEGGYTLTANGQILFRDEDIQHGKFLSRDRLMTLIKNTHVDTDATFNPEFLSQPEKQKETRSREERLARLREEMKETRIRKGMKGGLANRCAIDLLSLKRFMLATGLFSDEEIANGSVEDMEIPDSFLTEIERCTKGERKRISDSAKQYELYLRLVKDNTTPLDSSERLTLSFIKTLSQTSSDFYGLGFSVFFANAEFTGIKSSKEKMKDKLGTDKPTKSMSFATRGRIQAAEKTEAETVRKSEDKLTNSVRIAEEKIRKEGEEQFRLHEREKLTSTKAGVTFTPAAHTKFIESQRKAIAEEKKKLVIEKGRMAEEKRLTEVRMEEEFNKRVARLDKAREEVLKESVALKLSYEKSKQEGSNDEEEEAESEEGEDSSEEVDGELLEPVPERDRPRDPLKEPPSQFGGKPSGMEGMGPDDESILDDKSLAQSDPYDYVDHPDKEDKSYVPTGVYVRDTQKRTKVALETWAKRDIVLHDEEFEYASHASQDIPVYSEMDLEDRIEIMIGRQMVEHDTPGELKRAVTVEEFTLFKSVQVGGSTSEAQFGPRKGAVSISPNKKKRAGN